MGVSLFIGTATYSQKINHVLRRVAFSQEQVVKRLTFSVQGWADYVRDHQVWQDAFLPVDFIA